MWVATFAFLAAVMNNLVAHNLSAFYNGVLQAVYAGLYISPTPAPTPGLILSGITEANYQGYARQPVVWFPTFIDSAGPQDLAAQNMQFTPTGSATGNTITGAFIATALTGGVLYLAATLPVPVALPSPGYALDLSPVFQLSYQNNYGTPMPFA